MTHADTVIGDRQGTCVFIYINGDGETSRDFCFIDNAVQANLLAALTPGSERLHSVYNVACGGRTKLKQLFYMIRDALSDQMPELSMVQPAYRQYRPGDVRHSQADISKIRRELGYEPTHNVERGLRETLSWYVDSHMVSIPPEEIVPEAIAKRA